MQSKNYVPGVSGWKMHKDGRLEVSGVIRVVLPEGAQTESPPPFIIVDDVMYFSQAEIQRGTITKAEIGAGWKLKMKLHNDQYVVAGIGIGSEFLVSADRFQLGAGKILQSLSSAISETQLGRDFKKEDPFPERVREVIRQELRPGGLLYRSNR